MIALVTGASGFIGRALVDRLLTEGHAVRVLTRGHAHFAAGVDVRVGDLVSGAGIQTDLAVGVDTIFHCAGEVNDRLNMRPLHVDGTRRLLETALDAAARRDHPLHWVQLSSVGAYGRASNRSERIITETSPEQPTGEYEITKTESDALVTQAAINPTLTFTIVRPTNVIGPTMTNNSLRAVLRLIRRGWFLHVGRAGAIANYVHLDDVISATLECARQPAARGETFIVSSDCFWRDLVAYAAIAFNVRQNHFTVPEFVARSGASVAQRLGMNSLTVSRVDALTARTRYSPEKIERSLNFRPSKPMPGGIDDLLASMQ